MDVVPIWVPRGVTLDRIGVDVVVVATAGGLVRLGVYADNGALPAALLLDAGTVDTTIIGGRELSISLGPLNDGLYWLAAVAQVAGCQIRKITQAGGGFTPVGPTSFGGTNLTGAGYTVSGVNGALPDTLAGVSLSFATSAARIMVRPT